MRNGLLVSLMLGGLSVGCSDTTTNTPAGALPIESLETAVYSAACDTLFRCTIASERAATRELLGDANTCRAKVTQSAAGNLRDLVAAVRAGTVRYDGAAAQRCVSTIASSCNAVLNDPLNSCRSAFTGTVALGGQCWRSEECVGDAYCSHGTTPPRSCPGTCTARIALGAACNSDTSCTNTVLSRCAFGSGSSVCVEVRFGTAAAVGQPCGVTTAGNVETQTPCAAGLVCSDPEGVGTCRAPLAAGAACEPSDACPAGQLCVRETATGPRACRPTPVRNNVGDACTESGLTGYCNPVQRLVCVSGRCATTSSGAQGQACPGSGDFSVFFCNAGLYCDTTNNTCQPVKPTGQACTGDAQCASGECDPDARVCLARVCR